MKKIPIVQKIGFILLGVVACLFFIELSLRISGFILIIYREGKNHSQTLGEKLRKVRMDNGLMTKEFARLIGVTSDTVINWEIRDIKPEGENLERVREFLEN